MKLKAAFIVIIVLLLVLGISGKNSKKDVPANVETLKVETKQQTVKRETRIEPSNVKEAFEIEEPPSAEDYGVVDKTKIPRLKVTSKSESKKCDSGDNTVWSEFHRQGFRISNDCLKQRYFDFGGFRYTCQAFEDEVKQLEEGRKKEPSAMWLVLNVDVYGSLKPQGKALELKNCESKGYFTLNGQRYTCPFKPKPISYIECMKIKNSYGIKECYWEQSKKPIDYFAGAVKQCGGIDNMPSIEEITAIHSLLYEFADDRPLAARESRAVKLKRGMEKYEKLFSNEECGFKNATRIVFMSVSRIAKIPRHELFPHGYAICKLK